MITWNAVSRIVGSFKKPALISTVLVLPFMILQLVNKRAADGFPLVLFALMWLLPFTFVLIPLPIPQKPGAEKKRRINPLTLIPRVAILILIAWFWIGLLADQMPCFLGVPNCD